MSRGTDGFAWNSPARSSAVADALKIPHYSPVGPHLLMVDSSTFTGLPQEVSDGTWPEMDETE